MHKSFIMMGEKAVVSSTLGEIVVRNNSANIEGILKTENAIENLNNEYVSLKEFISYSDQAKKKSSLNGILFFSGSALGMFAAQKLGLPYVTDVDYAFYLLLSSAILAHGFYNANGHYKKEVKAREELNSIRESLLKMKRYLNFLNENDINARKYSDVPTFLEEDESFVKKLTLETAKNN